MQLTSLPLILSTAQPETSSVRLDPVACLPLGALAVLTGHLIRSSALRQLCPARPHGSLPVPLDPHGASLSVRFWLASFTTDTACPPRTTTRFPTSRPRSTRSKSSTRPLPPPSHPSSCKRRPFSLVAFPPVFCPSPPVAPIRAGSSRSTLPPPSATPLYPTFPVRPGQTQRQRCTTLSFQTPQVMRAEKSLAGGTERHSPALIFLGQTMPRTFCLRDPCLVPLPTRLV